MKETKDVVACVIDDGMFMPMAVSLSKGMKKVYYYTPWEKGFSEIRDSCLGAGVDGIQRLDDYLSPSVFGEIDLFVFPTIMKSGYQHDLIRQGKAVWGSRSGDRLEWDKGFFYRTLSDLGMKVPDHKVIIGLGNLRDYLRNHEDLWIKIDRYRGSMDTWHHLNYDQSRPYLDKLACHDFGPFQDHITFYVLKPINGIEGGIDSYSIDGQWPDKAVLGYEKKNEAYLAVVQEFDEMPEEFINFNREISPVLSRFQYRNWFSTEIRNDIFIDPTCRMASPAGEEQLDLYGNIHDIVWHGANGIMTNPDVTNKFAGEVYLHFTGDSEEWKSLRIPSSEMGVKLYACAYDGEFAHIPPDKENVIGCVVGIGNSVVEVMEKISESVKSLEGQPISAEIDAFKDLIDEIEEAEGKGIKFAPEKQSKLDKAREKIAES